MVNDLGCFMGSRRRVKKRCALRVAIAAEASAGVRCF